FTLIQTNVANVTAVVDGQRRYLLWSQDFLEKASPLEAHASVAHECNFVGEEEQTDLSIP
ncbi:MAG: hypothetical protein LH618_07610, partial [Saprospiraceae bacterium]|nr:hypothetical protein [Saprospiraceae bacterium]